MALPLESFSAYKSLVSLLLVRPPDAPKLGKAFECVWEKVEDHPNHDDPERVSVPGVRAPRSRFENVARTKVGGYASTIQSEPWWGYDPHPAQPRFCLQINSEEKASNSSGEITARSISPAAPPPARKTNGSSTGNVSELFAFPQKSTYPIIHPSHRFRVSTTSQTNPPPPAPMPPSPCAPSSPGCVPQNDHLHHPPHKPLVPSTRIPSPPATACDCPYRCSPDQHPDAVRVSFLSHLRAVELRIDPRRHPVIKFPHEHSPARIPAFVAVRLFRDLIERAFLSGSSRCGPASRCYPAPMLKLCTPMHGAEAVMRGSTAAVRYVSTPPFEMPVNPMRDASTSSAFLQVIHQPHIASHTVSRRKRMLLALLPRPHRWRRRIRALPLPACVRSPYVYRPVNRQPTTNPRPASSPATTTSRPPCSRPCHAARSPPDAVPANAPAPPITPARDLPHPTYGKVKHRQTIR